MFTFTVKYHILVLCGQLSNIKVYISLLILYSLAEIRVIVVHNKHGFVLEGAYIHQIPYVHHEKGQCVFYYTTVA